MYQHKCVVDAKGVYVTYVLTADGNILAYKLNSGEKLIDAEPPEDEVKTRWDGEEWV